MYITRIYTFNAIHKTHNPAISQGLNDQYYGKCNRYHGHSYELEITLKDSPFSYSFDDKVHDFITNELDHKNLNELEGIENENATTENLLEAVWSKIERLTDKEHLYRLRIKETDRNVFDYFGPSKEEII